MSITNWSLHTAQSTGSSSSIPFRWQDVIFIVGRMESMEGDGVAFVSSSEGLMSLKSGRKKRRKEGLSRKNELVSVVAIGVVGVGSSMSSRRSRRQ